MEVAINENLKKAIYRYFWRTILDKSTIFVVLIALACLIFLFYNFDKYTFYMFVSRMLFFLIVFLVIISVKFVFLNFVFKNIVVKIDVVEDGLCFTKSTGETLKINETNVSYVCFPFESCEKFHFKVECFLFNFNNNYFLFFPDTYDREISIEIMETYFKKRIMKKFYF